MNASRRIEVLVTNSTKSLTKLKFVFGEFIHKREK